MKLTHAFIAALGVALLSQMGRANAPNPAPATSAPGSGFPVASVSVPEIVTVKTFSGDPAGALLPPTVATTRALPTNFPS